jgi:hypothetical protein
MATHVRSSFALQIPIALLSLGLLCFGSAASASDPGKEPADESGGEYVKGHILTVTEDSTHVTTSQRIEATNDLITLGKDDTSLILGTKSITDKKTNTTTSYRTEVIRKDKSLTLVVTDLDTGRLIESHPFPAAGPGCFPAGEFDSLNACIAAFQCDKGAELLCQANRTCKPQFVGLTCCLKDGTAFSVHLVIRPTSFRCQFLDLAVDLEGMVLSRD